MLKIFEMTFDSVVQIEILYLLFQYLWFIAGSHMWTVWNEDRRCSPLAASVNQTLSLSACSAAQFNCADGGCTPLAARCDGWSDCYDEAR
jgi:hypothetical protein